MKTEKERRLLSMAQRRVRIQKRPVRRSQLISPWGIGNIVNFPNDESLMVCGLDAWEAFYSLAQNPKEYVFNEERLQKRLNVQEFRFPPDYRERGDGVTNPEMKVPFIRFPQWHYCPKCGHMIKMTFYGAAQKCQGKQFQTGMSCHQTPQYRRTRMIPVRFITVCSQGHIDDFPFMEWVHNGINHQEGHILRFRAGRNAGALSGIEITCNCGLKKSMAGAFNKGSLTDIKNCNGSRPWLGQTSSIVCGNELNVVQRGASNVYFPQIRTSIYLPMWHEKINRRLINILEENWSFLTKSRVDGKLDRNRFEMLADQKSLNVDELINVAQNRISGTEERNISDSEEDYRYVEYQALLNESGGDNQDFYVKKISSSKYSGFLSKYFENICLVHKLRETRAFCGFSRIVPDNNRQLEEMKLELGIRQYNWLPAVINRGEGLFFEFNSQALNSWISNSKIETRARRLIDLYNQSRINRGIETRAINPLFILLHTFSHLIINELSYECGYGSSSLRERIYCNHENINNRMNGVLIYTSSGDSEGSMGGVVASGRIGNLERIVHEALEKAQWCSYDPVCMDSEGQGTDSCNLAACYACALLPETSCEEMNRLLDRGVLVGTHDEPNEGYFPRT